MTKTIMPMSDVFSLRNNERVNFYGTDYPFPNKGEYILGVMRRSVSFPDGIHMDTVNTPENLGKPVAFEAIIACQWTDNGWVWVHLSPASKEVIGSLTVEWGLPVDQWGFLGFERAA